MMNHLRYVDSLYSCNVCHHIGIVTINTLCTHTMSPQYHEAVHKLFGPPFFRPALLRRLHSCAALLIARSYTDTCAVAPPHHHTAVLNARLPLLTLDQAVLCFPPSSSCILSSTAVDANATGSDNSLVKFMRRFQLRLPARPTVKALGNLVVYINTPSITAIPCQR